MLFGHAHSTHNAVKHINVYVHIYDVAVVTLCCPLGLNCLMNLGLNRLMNANKQTVLIVGQSKVISIKTPEKILQNVKSSTKVGKMSSENVNKRK